MAGPIPETKWLMSMTAALSPLGSRIPIATYETEEMAARHVIPVVRKALRMLRETIERFPPTDLTWSNTLEATTERIEREFQHEQFCAGVKIYNGFVRKYYLSHSMFFFDDIAHFTSIG